ncbi:DUF6542 domain-containing protein [Mycolicibacterium pulveris]|uniref:DUF6542 domain-containing protein n=1 Tax=Mycolicibacterium pulveris TaxID=36813 RepID=UPI003CFB5D03
MSAQRARSAVTADHRSVHPNIPGVPWWGAVLIAVTATTIGFAFDAGSGSKELSAVFAACYVLGCLGAVLAVRQAALFTAVIQPPLILFGAVPTAYFLFHNAQITSVKDALINCGYPLIERFPLMFFTSAAVLLAGAARWYYGMVTRKSTPQADTPGLASTLSTKLSSLLARPRADADPADEPAEPPRRRRTTRAPQRAERPDRPRRPARTPAGASGRGGKPTKGTTPSRSRHVRPPEESFDPLAERPRRSRAGRQAEPPPPQPRRRPRKTANPRQPGPPPVDRRSAYERPERRRRYDDYEPREPHGRNGNGTHHPISRVRYRGAEGDDDRASYRTRPRPARDRGVESWEYDI